MSKKKPADAFRLSIRHHPLVKPPLSLVYLHKIDGPARHCVMDGEMWPDMAAKLEEWATELGITVVVESSPWEGDMGERRDAGVAPGQGSSPGVGEGRFGDGDKDSTGDLFAEIPDNDAKT